MEIIIDLRSLYRKMVELDMCCCFVFEWRGCWPVIIYMCTRICICACIYIYGHGYKVGSTLGSVPRGGSNPLPCANMGYGTQCTILRPGAGEVCPPPLRTELATGRRGLWLKLGPVRPASSIQGQPGCIAPGYKPISGIHFLTHTHTHPHTKNTQT